MARAWVALYGKVSTSKKLARLKSDASRVFWFLLLTKADPWGRIEDDAETLTSLVWPMPTRTVAQTEKALEDLQAAGLIGRFSDTRIRWIQVSGWEDHAGKHRGGKPGACLFPEPPRFAPDCPELPRTAPEAPGQTGASRSLSPSPSPSLPFSSEEFSTLWSRWRKFRTEKKKPLTEEQESTQLAKLGKEGLFSATHRIERSIANGWQGLWMDNDPAVFTPTSVQGREPQLTGLAAVEEFERRLDERERTVDVKGSSRAAS